MNLADGHAFVPMLMAPWMLVIFTYAIFIPNTWQRALAVLGAGRGAADRAAGCT